MRRSHQWPRTKKPTATTANWEENWNKTEGGKPLSTIQNKELSLSFWKLQTFVAKNRILNALKVTTANSELVGNIKKYKEQRDRSKQKYCWNEKHGELGRGFHIWPCPMNGDWRNWLPKCWGYIVVPQDFGYLNSIILFSGQFNSENTF